MGLRFDPVGGGKFKEYVQQLAEIERQPIKQLESRKAIVTERLNLFQQFKGLFSGLTTSVGEISDLRKLNEFKVDLGDGNELMDVTVDKEKAQPGRYLMEIEDLAARSAMISNFFEDPNETELGIGFIVVDLPDGGSWETFIDSDESSLHGIAEKINSDKESPVRAAVIQDAQDPDNKWRLIITAKKDGYFNGVAFPQLYFLDGDQDIWVDDDIESQNALLKIDGFEIEGDGNDINNFLTGVNIHLKQARPGKPFMMNISVDTKKVSAKVQSVIDNINEVLKFINLQNAVDENTDTTRTFTGDTGLQGIEYRLRNLMHEGFFAGLDEEDENRVMHMHQLGVSFGKDGLLSFSPEKFEKLLEEEYDGISEALSGEIGFAFQLKEVLSGWTRPFDGLLTSREKSLRGRIDQIDRNIENQERVVEKRIATLVDRFSRLQGTLGNLQQQQQYLNASLGGGGGGLSIAGLLGG